MYISTFAGRTDAYTRHNGSQWVAVREPLAPAVVVDAITSGHPLSFYFLGPDNLTHVSALDFDTDDGWEQALAVGRAMWTDGTPAHVERSRRGAHLWCVADERLPAILWRRTLRAYLGAADLPTDDPRIELRPGSDRLSGPDSLGHALRAPMMPHPQTGEAHPLCDPRDGHPLHRKIAGMLLELQQAPAERIIAAAERWQPPAIEATVPRRAVRLGTSPIEAFNAVGVSAVLTRDWGCDPMRTRPGTTVRCPAHPDRVPSLSIARDDSRAWCHSPSCELHGPDGAGHDAYSLWQLAKRAAT